MLRSSNWSVLRIKRMVQSRATRPFVILRCVFRVCSFFAEAGLRLPPGEEKEDFRNAER